MAAGIKYEGWSGGETIITIMRPEERSKARDRWIYEPTESMIKNHSLHVTLLKHLRKLFIPTNQDILGLKSLNLGIYLIQISLLKPLLLLLLPLI